MTSKYPTNPLQKIRVLYKQVQNQFNNNQLNRITEERMKKRYAYAARQIEKKQENNDRSNIEEFNFYRNKFHSLMVLVAESMRESYNKNRFETAVQNILKENWEDNNETTNQNIKKNAPTFNYLNQPQQNDQFNQGKQTPLQTNPGYYKQKDQPANNFNNARQQIYQNGNANKNSNLNRSLSPLEEFFQENSKKIERNKKALNFKSVIPQSQLSNSKLLDDIKKMNKKSASGSVHRDLGQDKLNRDNSRIRDLRRENDQLQIILRKRQNEDVEYDSKRKIDQLQKQVYYFQKTNEQLREEAGYPRSRQISSQESPYTISYRQNNVNRITSTNMQKSARAKALDQLNAGKSQQKLRSQSYITNSKVNDDRSNNSRVSSTIQKQKQVYINSTPQILFQNELIKVLVVRYPLKVHERGISSSQRLNPEDLVPNEERLELMVLNNAKKLVKNQELFVNIEYDYDKKFHELKSFKNPNRGYSKIAQTSKDIVYSEIVKIKLLNREGYNEQIKAMINSQFFYTSDIKKRKIFAQEIKDKKKDKFAIQVKLPVTFIQFSNRPFSIRQTNLRKNKLTIKPNSLYDTLEHTYMNTNLHFSKPTDSRNIKENAVVYGRSFIHDNNGKGTYLESQINLAWFEKKNVRYISIETIEEWVYLLAYIFLDVTQEQEQFQKQFRKPSMHVYFNLQDKQYV